MDRLHDLATLRIHNAGTGHIRGQVPAGLPAMKPVALLQIVALQRAQDLLNAEIDRLTRLYELTEQSQQCDAFSSLTEDDHHGAVKPVWSASKPILSFEKRPMP